MDGVGKVDGVCPRGQALHIPLGGEDKNFVSEHVHLQGGDKFIRVGVLLRFQQLAYPLEGLLGTQLLICHALLVFPVGGNAVLGGIVHFLGTYLHLEGNALPANDGGVEGLVAVGLGG